MNPPNTINFKLKATAKLLYNKIKKYIKKQYDESEFELQIFRLQSQRYL